MEHGYDVISPLEKLSECGVVLMGILCEFYSQKTNVYSPNLIIFLHSVHNVQLFIFIPHVRSILVPQLSN